jgi:hypothetical protein
LALDQAAFPHQRFGLLNSLQRSKRRHVARPAASIVTTAENFDSDSAPPERCSAMTDSMVSPAATLWREQ